MLKAHLVVKEHPIIFSSLLVPKVLDGTKTMTRRTWGLEKVNKNPDDWQLIAVFLDGQARFYNSKTDEDITLKCPYGGVGDRLWMKETFGLDEEDQPVIFYKTETPDWGGKWRPSIHMPRWASRKDLVITTLRVERVQEITQEDCVAEGAEYMPCASPREQRLTASQIVFADFWDSLNAKRGYSWEFNPWGWVIGFEKRNREMKLDKETKVYLTVGGLCGVIMAGVVRVILVESTAWFIATLAAIIIMAVVVSTYLMRK